VFLLSEHSEDENSTISQLVISTNEFCIDEYESFNNSKILNNKIQFFKPKHIRTFYEYRMDEGEFSMELCPRKCDNVGSGNPEAGPTGLELLSPCLVKCCMPHQLLVTENFSCVDVQGDRYWNPVISINLDTSFSKNDKGILLTCLDSIQVLALKNLHNNTSYKRMFMQSDTRLKKFIYFIFLLHTLEMKNPSVSLKSISLIR